MAAPSSFRNTALRFLASLIAIPRSPTSRTILPSSYLTCPPPRSSPHIAAPSTLLFPSVHPTAPKTSTPPLSAVECSKRRRNEELVHEAYRESRRKFYPPGSPRWGSLVHRQHRSEESSPNIVIYFTEDHRISGKPSGDGSGTERQCGFL